MADLQHCIKNLIYKPIVNRNLSNLDTFSALLKDMLTADHHERATMKSIISNKLVVGPYYQKYFDFGFDVYFGLIDDSMFRKWLFYAPKLQITLSKGVKNDNLKWNTLDLCDL